MPARVLVPLALFAALLAGCGASAAGDPALTVHLSAPLSGSQQAAGRQLAEGARAALADAGGTAGGIRVSLRVHDDAGRTGWEPALESAAARRASEDSTAIAFIGAPRPAAVMAALPITYAAGILQVAPEEEGRRAPTDGAGGGGDRYRAYGYAAMAAVLAAIEGADDPLDREAVRDAFPAGADAAVRAA